MAAYTCEKCGDEYWDDDLWKMRSGARARHIDQGRRHVGPYLYVSRWTRQDQITDVLRPGYELRGRLRPGEDIF